jgi:hypothetical protein
MCNDMHMDTGADTHIRIYPMLKSSTLRHVVGAEYPLHRLFPTFLILRAVSAPVGALRQRLSSRRVWANGVDQQACGRQDLRTGGGRSGCANSPDTVVGLTINLKLV